MSNETREALETIIKQYGKLSQEDKAVEECSELIQAIMKFRRYPTDVRKSDVIDEIADVKIMLDQLLIIYDCEEEVAERVDYKINRQLNRIISRLSGLLRKENSEK